MKRGHEIEKLWELNKSQGNRKKTNKRRQEMTKRKEGGNTYERKEGSRTKGRKEENSE